ncbi:MHFG family PEP-CTERM protein [Duganella aceris]|uniref:PEP-CTERM sorting domain-containing protein n=1 Tax=Duganella aceris TaxID=2703883 RepID=A0ABX0FKG9_9BURK|nr:MHFG family PEP-CTERM protein [Duganella aceris]NGZ85012.1 PEP-CTERM sorting domain-containing protein [Duganella aceris]
MTILLAITLAAAIQPTCSWDRPGQNPYTGGAAAAIDHYTDIPATVRGTLKRRMAEGQSDDQVNITRDGISGKNQYGAQIRDMHFGKNSVCGTVTRSKWAADRVEPAAVYCVGAHCVLVPKICGNVSRITRNAPAVAAAKQAADGAAADGNQHVIPDGIQQFDDTGLVDAPLREQSIELEPLEQAARDRTRRVLGGLNPPAEPNGGFGPGPRDQPGQPVAAPVPEPETWTMLLGGLGLVGWFARRRARAAAAVGDV